MRFEVVSIEGARGVSITIENAEVEAPLADLAAQTCRSGPDLLLELPLRERERLEHERRIAKGRAIDDALRERWNACAHIDPRAAGDLLSIDESAGP